MAALETQFENLPLKSTKIQASKKLMKMKLGIFSTEQVSRNFKLVNYLILNL